MNSPDAYSTASSGSRIDASFVSPLHGFDRTSINTSAFSLNFSPLKNNTVLQKLNRYKSLLDNINSIVEQPFCDSSQLIINVSTPPKSVGFEPSPKSTRRRRQSLLVFEALDNISSVSKTPTKVKIRKSSAFLGSSSKMRLESFTPSKEVKCLFEKRNEKQGCYTPTATSTEELLQVLAPYISACPSHSLLEASEAEDKSLTVHLSSCSAEDLEISAALSPAHTDTEDAAAYAQQSTQSETQRDAKLSVASPPPPPSAAAAAAAVSPPQSASTSRKTLLSSAVDGRKGGNNAIRDENLSHNIPDSQASGAVPTTPMSSSKRSSSRFHNVMNSCSKVLQEIDVVICQ
jgi:hypothetical protein